MRFDSSIYWHTGEVVPWHQQVQEYREFVTSLEELGFVTAWVAEHHLAHDGYFSSATNPILTGLDMALHTKKLRVGQSPTSICDWHPIRVAEDIAALDHMTKGRVDFGIGRGTDFRWAAQLNPLADRRNDEQNYALFIESLDVILKSWTEEAFSHKGKFYTFPTPGWKEHNPVVNLVPPHYTPDGELVAISVLPKPYQQPHPPVWQMVTSNKSWAYAGTRGINAMGSARSLEGNRESFIAYKDAANAEGRDLALGENASIQYMTFCAKTMEEAVKIARPGINALYSHISTRPDRLRPMIMGKDEKLSDEDLNCDWFDFLWKHDVIIVGTPDHIAERLDNLQREISFQHFQIFPSIPEITFRQYMDCLELFGTEVMPRFEEKAGAREQISVADG